MSSAGPLTNKIVEILTEIAKNEQFVKYRQTIVDFINNKKDNNIYFQLLELQDSLEEKRSQGLRISQEEQDELAELGEKAFALESVKKFIAAQDALAILSDMVNIGMEYVMDSGEAPSAEYLFTQSTSQE